MKKCQTLFRVVLLIGVLLPGAGGAAERLRPDPSYAALPGTYDHKLKQVFRESIDQNVMLSVMIKPPFDNERVAGLRRLNGKTEIFVLEASSRIIDLELIEEYETRPKGGYATLDEDAYRQLKAESPRDVTQVKTTTSSSTVPEGLATRIASICEAALLAVAVPSKSQIKIDGTTYTFAMQRPRYGYLSGSTTSPSKGSKIEALALLADEMAKYAKGKSDTSDISRAIALWEKGTD